MTDRAEAELERIRAMLPDWAVLDPPDGGDVRTWEGVERVVDALRASDERAEKAEGELKRMGRRARVEFDPTPDATDVIIALHGRAEAAEARVVKLEEALRELNEIVDDAWRTEAARAALEDKP